MTDSSGTTGRGFRTPPSLRGGPAVTTPWHRASPETSPILTVAQAQARVLEHAHPLPATLGPPQLGRVLAEDVASDLDVPPYDKALMDGYAVRAADLPDGRGSLTV